MNKKATFNNIYKSIDKEHTKDIECFGCTVKVKKYISFGEYVSFVRNVVDGCFNTDSSEYLPELKNILISIYTLVYYCGIKVPEDMSKAYDVVIKTGLLSEALMFIDKDQMSDIINAINDKIEYNSSVLANSYTDRVNTLINEVAKITDNINSIDINESVSGIGNTIGKMLKVVGERSDQSGE